MTQKEQLVEYIIGYPLTDSIKVAGTDCVLISRRDAEDLAEKLIDADGVIIPPCKVGDTVYVIAPYCEYRHAADCHESCALCEHRRSTIDAWEVQSLYQVISVLQSWGTNCFATYEAAEQALKELDQHE